MGLGRGSISHRVTSQLIESKQRDKYLESARSVGAKFCPLVLETMGTMGLSFKKFIRKIQMEFFRNINSSDPNLGGELKIKLLHLWTTRFSCVLQIANAKLILSKLSRVQQATARGSPTVASS